MTEDGIEQFYRLSLPLTFEPLQENEQVGFLKLWTPQRFSDLAIALVKTKHFDAIRIGHFFVDNINRIAQLNRDSKAKDLIIDACRVGLTPLELAVVTRLEDRWGAVAVPSLAACAELFITGRSSATKLQKKVVDGKISDDEEIFLIGRFRDILKTVSFADEPPPSVGERFLSAVVGIPDNNRITMLQAYSKWVKKLE